MQRLILDAARDLFASDGYEAVTMRRIADRIDYTPTAIYFHFRDKGELFRRLCAEDFGALAARFQVLARVPDPVERLRMLGRAYVAFALDHPNHYRLLFMAPRPDGGAEGSGSERGGPESSAYAFLRRAVMEAGAAGRFVPEYSDLDLAAQTLWAGLHGVASLEIGKRDDAGVPWRPRNERVEAMVDVLLRGLTGAEA
jgi:AcrR family transcriptional regulator